MAAKNVVEKSSGMVHVFSTLANPQNFVRYDPPSEVGMFPTERMKVTINGGAGIASKNLITPMGTHTSITSEEYDAIKDLPHFQKFVDSGHIRVERKEHDIEKIVGDSMNPRDPGGPLTPADYENKAKDGQEPVPVALERAGSGWVANQLSNR